MSGFVSRLFGRAAAPTLDASRWIVLDVETSGLDMRHDRLLAIAAIALHRDAGDSSAAPRIALADSFESLLAPDDGLALPADKGNILLHGIGVGEQRKAAAAAAVLAAFERWVGASPLIAFHAVFDRTMIERAMKRALGRTLANAWLDLDPVAQALVPGTGARALDDWLDHFAIDCHPRHQAAADTLATAELLLRLWPAARIKGCTDFAALAALEANRRWLVPQ